jgi:hypothetical protein
MFKVFQNKILEGGGPREGQRELKDEGLNILNSSADVILMIKLKMTT